jgi:putative FmdB family regulatory protein
MPIYEYRCDKCGAKTEVLQRLSDAPPKKCPECGKSALKKMVTAAGFQLKGTGWYVTDFRDNGAKPAAKSDSSAKSDKSDVAKGNEAPAKAAPKTETAAPAPTKTKTAKAAKNTKNTTE